MVLCEHCGEDYSTRGISAHQKACEKKHGNEQETHDARIDSVTPDSSAADNQEDRNDVVDRLSGTAKPDKTQDTHSDNKESDSNIWGWVVGIGSAVAILAGFALGGKVK